jgi:hypothetical protein
MSGKIISVDGIDRSELVKVYNVFIYNTPIIK